MSSGEKAANEDQTSENGPKTDKQSIDDFIIDPRADAELAESKRLANLILQPDYYL